MAQSYFSGNVVTKEQQQALEDTIRNDIMIDRHRETAEFNALLESQALQDTSIDFLPGGRVANKVVKGGVDTVGAGHTYLNRVGKEFKNNRTAGAVDKSKRKANIALASIGSAFADPAAVPKFLGDALSLNTPSIGLGNTISSFTKSIGGNAIDIARAKNYRMNKIAGSSDEQAVILDAIARSKLKMGKPGKIKKDISQLNNVREDFFGSDVNANTNLLYNMIAK